MFGGGNSETVVLLRPPAKDTYGDPVTGTTAETNLDGVLFAPSSTTELTDGANQVRADGAVYGPPDLDVLPTDRLRIRDQVYEVVGKPQRWGQFGIVIHVRLITG